MHQIKNSLKLSFFLWMLTLLTACSPINSVEPFGPKQATILLKQFYVTKPAQQMIAIKLPDRSAWKKINVSKTSLSEGLLLVPQKENEINWHESILTEVVPYARLPNFTLLDFVKNKFQKANKACCNVKTAILVETAHTIIFTLDLAECSAQKDQTQIGKAFAGKEAIYAVRYAALTGTTSQKHYEEMAQTIKKAQLVAK